MLVRPLFCNKHKLVIIVVQSLNLVQLLATYWHTRLPCPFSLSPRVFSNSCPLSWWCHPVVSSSVVPFSGFPQSFKVLGSFPMSQLFSSCGQIYRSFSFSISPSNEYSGLISSRTHWFDLPTVHYIYYCGQESIRRNGVALIVNKSIWNVVLGGNLKDDRMISVCFQGKPFNISVTKVYAPITNVEEVEVERFYEDLQDL